MEHSTSSPSFSLVTLDEVHLMMKEVQEESERENECKEDDDEARRDDISSLHWWGTMERKEGSSLTSSRIPSGQQPF